MSKNIHIRAGANKTPTNPLESITIDDGGAIVFFDANSKEVLRFDPNGHVFVREKLVDIDSTIYQAFRGWLMRAKMEMGTEGLTVAP